MHSRSFHFETFSFLKKRALIFWNAFLNGFFWKNFHWGYGTIQKMNISYVKKISKMKVLKAANVYHGAFVRVRPWFDQILFKLVLTNR